MKLVFNKKNCSPDLYLLAILHAVMEIGEDITTFLYESVLTCCGMLKSDWTYYYFQV